MAVAAYDGRPFSGAKLALWFGPRLLVLLRDDLPGLPYAGFWDFPGGGREAGESPAACVLRETREETGLVLKGGDLRWGRGVTRDERRVWIFAARLPESRLGGVRFGDEGQGWRLMAPAEFEGHPRAVPELKHRLVMARAGFPGA